MRPLLLVGLLIVGLAGSAACRRENPAIARAATASVATAVAVAAIPTVTPTVLAAAASAGAPAPARSTPSGRRAKINAGNLGIASAGIGAGLQVWSKPGGVMAGGATMTGAVADGASVEIIGEESFLGQRYVQVRGGGAEGWVEARFVQPEGG